MKRARIDEAEQMARDLDRHRPRDTHDRAVESSAGATFEVGVRLQGQSFSHDLRAKRLLID
jgi:hypothetical protein